MSGEHGIGLLKRDGMRRELDPGALAMQEAVRRALGPAGHLQPGQGLRLYWGPGWRLRFWCCGLVAGVGASLGL